MSFQTGRWLLAHCPAASLRNVRTACLAILGLFAAGGLGGQTLLAETPLTVPDAVLAAQQQRVDAINRAKPTAVAVFVPGGAGGGSGALISPDGYALTNFHVSSPAGTHMRCGLSDGKVYDAVIIGIDPVGDLAMIRLLGRDDFPAAELGDSDRLQPGDACFVVGNPFLLASNLQPTVTYGILSGVRRYQYPAGTLLEYANCLQTDASINPGNSGGPIYDREGRLIGIVGRASFEKRGRVNVGVGYAISINQAKNFIGYLRSGRIVDHATLGATVVTGPDGGAIVSNILESSDAFRRGLRYGDEILELAGQPILTANDLKNVLGTLPKGWRVPLVFRHNGETIETLVRLPGVHLRDELLTKMKSALPPPPPRPEPVPPAPGKGPEDPAKPESEEGPAPGDPLPGDTDADSDEGGLPKAVEAVFTAREGYANYFVNAQAQQRIWKSLRASFPQSGADQTWTLRGQADDGRSVTIKVGREQQSLQFGGADDPAAERLQLSRPSDLYEAVERASPTALLASLDALKRMIDQGPGKFGDTSYLGTVPFLGERPLRDCLVATAGDLETRFLALEGRLDAVESFAGRDTDPAELLFFWPAGEDQRLPMALELRFGTEPKLRIEIESWTLQPATLPAES